ncbi:restriction endonuclease subunit S, partial [bacterium]|nr:restriction endonuclease subunit S [bacterium]
MNNDVTTKHTKGTKNKAYPKYKPSGVEWLGDVPEHWGVKKLKHTANLYGRIGFRGYTTDDLVDEGEGAITLSPSNMKDGELHLEKSTYISWEKYYESPEIVIRPEDVVIVKTGSTFGKISYVRQVEHPITLNPQLAVFKSLKCNNRFFFFYIGAPYIQDQISLSNTGSTIPTMTQQTIMSYAIPLPPLPEQQA